MSRPSPKTIGPAALLCLVLWCGLVAIGPENRRALSRWLADAGARLLILPPLIPFGTRPPGSP